MWFVVLSLVIAVALLSKATIALSAPQRFYAERRRHYASAVQPAQLLVAPAVIVALTLTAWHATFFHYRPWGWIVTAFLTALACFAVDHVFRWENHRLRMVQAVTNPKVWQLDCLLLALGSMFVALAWMVY
jgi:hypothetical protein